MKSRRLARLALMAVPAVAVAAPMSMTQLAKAATTIVVGTTVDLTSGTDCTTAITGSGTANCSLRAAVQQANSDAANDVIQLGAHTYTLNIIGTGNNDNAANGDLDMFKSMTLHGAGAGLTIINTAADAAGAPWNDRVLEADLDDENNAPTVTIQDLTVTGGNDTGVAGEQTLEGGGGILNDFANLTLHNVIVTGNHTDNSGGGVSGNAQAGNNPLNTLTITNSTISNNDASLDGGGLFTTGTTDGANNFSNLFITGNTAHGSNPADNGGGGIYEELFGTGSATFTDVMVVGNHAPGMGGGGVYVNGSFLNGNTSSPVVFKNITISGNTTQDVGGGFYVHNGFATLTNATVSNNTVSGVAIAVVGEGGGIAAGVTSGRLTVNNATINGNSAPLGGGGAAAVGGADNIHLHNTILFNNTAASAVKECLVGDSATIDSTGYNIVDDNTCALVPTTDRQGSTFNPNLGALQDNTGPTDGAPGATSPTLTEALPKGSIAIDTADPTAANNPTTDERGITRPQGAQSDVGAYEYVPVAPVLPAAGHPPVAPQPWAPWALLVTAAMAAAVAVRWGGRLTD